MAKDDDGKKKVPKIKDKWIYTGVAVAAIIGLMIYMVVKAIPERSPSGNSLPATQSQSQSQSQSYIPILPDNTPESGDQGSGESSGPAVSNAITEDYVKLMTAIKSDGNPRIACYVYIPSGFTAIENPTSVSIYPSDMDLLAEGNKAMKLKWSSITAFEDLKLYGTYTDSRMGTYTILHQFDYAAHETLNARVYVIELAPPEEKAETVQKIYTIAIDISNEGLYPSIVILEQDLEKYLSARYPDISKLSEAMFRPV